jgi:hypothetical protein
MHAVRHFRLPLLVLLAAAAYGQTAAKRPLAHRDYDGWLSITTPALSRDGKFLAYALFPEDGDAYLVVRNLTTGKELRENAGAVPSTPENTESEVHAEAGPPAPRSIHIAFTHDNAFVVTGAFPSKAKVEQARKDRKRADEIPRESMIIVDLARFSATHVADVASFQVPELGESFVAYLRGPKPGSQSSRSDTQGRDQAGRGRGGAAGRGNRPQYDSDLLLRDLRSGKERTFADVIEYSISKDAKTVLYAVSSKAGDSNGVYAVTPGSDDAPATLLAGKGSYTKITWDFAHHRAAFLSDRDDPSGKPAKFKAYL